jgi:hypothetical protein
VAAGCSDVSGGLEVGLQMDLDPDRELQRIHSLFITHMERLERLRCNYTAHTRMHAQQCYTFEKKLKIKDPLNIEV